MEVKLHEIVVGESRGVMGMIVDANATIFTAGTGDPPIVIVNVPFTGAPVTEIVPILTGKGPSKAAHP